MTALCLHTALAFLLATILPSRTNAFSANSVNLQGTAFSTTVLYYINGDLETIVPTTETVEVSPVQVPPAKLKPAKRISTKKPTIYPITSLQELYDFLQEDDRLTAIKIYAPWCKYCQKVGLHFQGLAAELGDGVIARRAVKGKIRCASIEYSSVTARLITEHLQIQGVPSLQLYKGTTKLWQSKSNNDGHPNKNNKIKTSDLKREVKRLLAMPDDECKAYLRDFQDDGILEEAMEESFFDNHDYAW